MNQINLLQQMYHQVSSTLETMQNKFSINLDSNLIYTRATLSALVVRHPTASLISLMEVNTLDILTEISPAERKWAPLQALLYESSHLRG